MVTWRISCYRKVATSPELPLKFTEFKLSSTALLKFLDMAQGSWVSLSPAGQLHPRGAMKQIDPGHASQQPFPSPVTQNFSCNTGALGSVPVAKRSPQPSIPLQHGPHSPTGVLPPSRPVTAALYSLGSPLEVPLYLATSQPAHHQ